MPRSSRRRPRKHDGYQEERDRSDSDEDPRPRGQEEKKGSARASKGSEQHEKRLPSALAKLSDAGGACGSSVEGQKKRKGREEQEAVAGDDRWSGRGGGEDDAFGYYDSKKSRNSDGDVKRRSTSKFEESDRSNEVGRRKSERGALLEEDSAGEHHRVKDDLREHGAEKSKESKQVVVLKEDSMDQQYTMVKDRSREHGAEKGNESRHDGPREHGADKSKESKQVVVLKEDSMDQQFKMVKDRSREHGVEKGNETRHDASSKVMARNKEVKTQDSDGDRVRNKCNGIDANRQFQEELHDGELEKNGRHRKTKDQSDGKDESQSGSRDRQTMSRDLHTKIDGCYEQQHRDVKYKDEMSKGVEKRREGKYKDETSKPEDRHKDNKYKDDRHKEEERHRDERSRNEYRHRDGKYKEERSKEHKDERYKEKSRDVEKPRNNERSDDSLREKHRDDIYKNHRHQDGRSWDARSSKDNTRDKSLEKHYKEEHNCSESRHNKNRLHDSEGDTSAAGHRSFKYRDDNKAKKRSYEESVGDGDLESRNAKEHHGDATKRRSEAGSFVSSADRRREYVIQEKVESRRRDYEKKNPTRSSTYPIREQSRHFPKQEDSSPKEYSAASGRHRRTSDFQSVEGQSKTDVNMNGSLASKDGRSLRSDGRPIHLSDRSPSASDRQVSNRSNVRHSHDTADDLLKKGNAKHHDLPLNRQATENYQSASPGHLPPPPDRFEMDTRRSFEEDNRSHTRERRSSSLSRRSGTVDNARGHGNTWNNPSSWPSPVPNGFGPFQHGPPLPGFHPAMHQFPQSFFGMRPSMDLSHTGVPYPLHEHPESFSHCAQPFPWRNPAEDPYLPRLPGWDANRNVFEEYSHSYDRQELSRNKYLEFQQQPEVPFSAHGTSDKPSLMQFPGQIRSEQSNAESSEIKIVDVTNAGKTDAQAPKYMSERKPGPSNVKVDNSQFCSNYFKRLDISTSLASPELHKKCVTMLGTLDPAGSCKLTLLRSLQNNKDEHECEVKGSKYMIKSIFSGKTTSVFENAMALYRSNTGSMKSKIPASSTHPKGEEVIKQAYEDMAGEVNVTAPEGQALPRTDMCNELHIIDQPPDGVDLSMPGESGTANDCSNIDEDKVGSNTGDKSLSINHGEGHACYTAEQQAPSNGEGELPRDAKALRPCCNSEGSLTDVAKEQFSGVISDAAFASSSQACEDIMPGCRVNLNRIPCSPGST